MAEITFNVCYIIVAWQFAQRFGMKSTQVKQYLHKSGCDVSSWDSTVYSGTGRYMC